MYQSNFQKLLAANPSISSKNKPLSSASKDSKIIDTDHGQYKRIDRSKITSVSSKINQTKISELSKLSQFSGFSKSSETKSNSSSSDYHLKRVDRKAAPRVMTASVKQEPPKKVRLTDEEFKQLTRQQKQIEEYKAEWFNTTKLQLHVPPLHDPIVLMHHYGLGPLQDSVFHHDQVENETYDDSDYKHVLLRLVAVTKFGQVVYDHMVAPSDKITNYRTDVTGLSQNHFQQNYIQSDTKNTKANKNVSSIYTNPNVKTLEQVRAEIAEIIDNRFVVGFGLSSTTTLQKLQKELLLARFSTQSRRKDFTQQQQDVFDRDMRLDNKLRSGNNLLELLLVSHPPHLLRDFLLGQIIPHSEMLIDGQLPNTAQFIHHQEILLQDPQLQQRLQKQPSEYQQTQLVERKNRDEIVKRDNFATLARPLDFASLDTLLNQSMSLLQFYYIYKVLWDQFVNKKFGSQISSYRIKMVELIKVIERQREIEEIKAEQEREKVARRQRYEERQENKKQKEEEESSDDDDNDDDDDSATSKSRWNNPASDGQ